MKENLSVLLIISVSLALSSCSSTYSKITDSKTTNAIFENSTVTGSTIDNSTLEDSNVADSTIFVSEILGESKVRNGSIIRNSKIEN